MRHACVLCLMAASGVACAQQFDPDAPAFPRADAPPSRAVSMGMVGSMASSGVSFGSIHEQPDADAGPPTSEDLVAPPPLHLTGLPLYWENDGAYVKRFDSADRHYTNGLRAEASFQPGLIPSFGDWLDSWLSIGGTQRHAGGLAVSQLMFTPEDISEPDLIEDDRPYAGYLYTSLFHQRRTETVFDHVELQFGVVGEWSGAEGVQKAAHAAFPNEPRPEGWSNQLANELGVGLFYQRRWRSRQVPLVWGLEADAIPHVGFHLGNVWTDASVGGTVRLGYRIPDDFGVPRISEFRDATALPNHDEPWGVYGFARVTGTAVARNLFLDGNTFAHSHSVGSKPLVGDLTLGLAARYRCIELTYSITWMTEEFEGQEGSDSYGTLALGWNFDW